MGFLFWGMDGLYLCFFLLTYLLTQCYWVVVPQVSFFNVLASRCTVAFMFFLELGGEGRGGHGRAGVVLYITDCDSVYELNVSDAY